MAKTAADKTVAKKAPPTKKAAKPTLTKTVEKKTPAKASAKPVAKVAPKTAAKAIAKPATKSVAKPAPKVAAKATSKAVAKPAAKPAAKPVAKVAPKAAAKATAKPAAKSVAKPAPKVAAKATTKAVAKPAAKPAVKPAVKVAPKLAPKAAPKAVAKAPAKPAAKSVAKKPLVTPNKVTAQKPARAIPKRAEAPSNTPTAPAAPKRAAARIKPLDGSVLTEAQLLKMSEKDYMNAAQLGFFKALLTSMKAEILVNARETGEHLKENESFADPNDRATVEEENMLEQRVRDRERKLLKKIDQALARLEEGEYGYCLETGEPIGLPRLLARPTAELSIEAQEKHERREKLFAD